MGKTLYLGSMKSDVYFCIYEKDYEQLIRNGIPLADSEIKNRFEIRLKMNVPNRLSLTLHGMNLLLLPHSESLIIMHGS